MKPPFNWFLSPPLTPFRRWGAMAVAVVADGLQFLVGPLGWVGLDQAIDAVAMVLTSALIGFHPLLLPTFLIELIPVADLLPTWTGCVWLVISLRKKQHTEVVDIEATTVPNKPTQPVPPQIPPKQ